uniref:PIPK domain-containing protein n=1 Tax=Globodera pallida TaxID=36090 RepID=A0A183BR00_GLOPA
MHDINAPWLSILLGKYLCDKLVKGKTDSSVDFKKEKSVWTPVAVVKKGDTDLVDPHGFSVRAEKLFTLITNKFGITDMALLQSLSDFLPLLDRGGCNGVFYITKDSKYIVKWVNDRHGELEKMDEVLDKYVQYVLTKGENSMMNRFHMNFKMTLYAKLRENKMNVIKLKKLQFVVLNNAFYGIEPEKLLKFDIKGTFSPGSANGIELDKPEYTRLTQALHNDAQYLSANEVNDYSLLLGVHFLDKAPKKKDKIDTNCIYATCRDCKRLPDAVYKPEQHLCLYMAIVDILAPSTKEAQEHFLRILKERRAGEFDKITTMADFNGFQLETVSPIPAPQYVGRFLGTVLGCIFRPALSLAQANNNQILMNGLSQGICHSFGEERNTFVEKHDTFVKKMEKISDGKEEKQWDDWGVALYAFEQFKEEMDKRKMPSWDLLVSIHKQGENIQKYYGLVRAEETPHAGKRSKKQ